MFNWDATLYSRFLTERTQPAIDLARRIPLTAAHRVIDIGCGPGNSTKVIADRFPEAQVTGADCSEEMIRQAGEQYPELNFVLFDAVTDFEKLSEKFDVVFSNACIQWIPDQRKLIRDMAGALKPGGVLAVQLPYNYDEPIHRIIRNVADREPWRGKLKGARQKYTLEIPEYAELLSDVTDSYELWVTTYYHRMPTHESILEWYRGTGLRPYLAHLDAAEADAYEQEVLAEIRKAYPEQANGEILFRFPRLFFMAEK